MDFLFSKMNEFHDVVVESTLGKGYPITDKHLHFVIIGLLGYITYLVIHFLMKKLVVNTYKATTFSFLTSFLIVVGISFAIEGIQRHTGGGNVELMDMVANLLGFCFYFIVHIVIKSIFLLLTKLFSSIHNFIKTTLFHF